MALPAPNREFPFFETQKRFFNISIVSQLIEDSIFICTIGNCTTSYCLSKDFLCQPPGAEKMEISSGRMHLMRKHFFLMATESTPEFGKGPSIHPEKISEFAASINYNILTQACIIVRVK